MYKKMVVLLDGSELAEVVFDYAQELAGRMGVCVELLHVCSPREVSQLPMRRAYLEQRAKQLHAEAQEISVRYSRQTTELCGETRGTVVVGYPAEEILNYVDENDIDLVMMSTHGSSGVRAWGLGGVANKVVHASKVPVWLVPAELREEVISDTLPRRVMVVPLSGSPQSAVALPHAVEILAQRGAETDLVLLHLMDVFYSVAQRDALDRFEAKRAEMKKYLEGLAQPIRESGLVVHTEVLVGDPARSIIEYLKGHPTQLLVMAARGRTRLDRMVFGSLAESVLHMVKVTPLLLVSGEE